ncbi:MAG: hypothetical protein OHK0029_00700 [Armatimonadaceae bacterium]
MYSQNTNGEDQKTKQWQVILVVAAVIVGVGIAVYSAVVSLLPPRIEVMGSLDGGGAAGGMSKDAMQQDPSMPKAKGQ